jgi:Tfp pilus assembly major pilin PilA
MEVIFGFLLVAIGIILIMAIVIESVEMYYRRKERNG